MQQFLKLTTIHATSPPCIRGVFPPLYGTLLSVNNEFSIDFNPAYHQARIQEFQLDGRIHVAFEVKARRCH